MKINQYLIQNQRFEKDKASRQINVTIMPMENESDTWSKGWFVNINVTEFIHQLCSISFKVISGLNFSQNHRNNLSHNELFKIFDWGVYFEEQSQIITVTKNERELKKHKQECKEFSQARITLSPNGTTTSITACEETKYAIEKCMPLKKLLD